MMNRQKLSAFMAEPEQIEISSYILEKLKNKGLVLWKNMDWKNADMP